MGKGAKLIKSYSAQYRTAFDASSEFEIPRIQWDELTLPDNYIDQISALSRLWLMWTGFADPAFKCGSATMTIVTLLRVAGVKAEAVIGDLVTKSNGRVFRADKAGLLNEYRTQILSEKSNMHAWIQLGGGVIVDVTVPSFLAKKGLECNGYRIDDMVHVEFLSERKWSHGLRYEPLLVGIECLNRIWIEPLSLYAHHIGVFNDDWDSMSPVDFIRDIDHRLMGELTIGVIENLPKATQNMPELLFYNEWAHRAKETGDVMIYSLDSLPC